MKIFLDTDIILDLLSRREPFYQTSKNLFIKIEKREFTAFISPIIVANIYYILRRIESDKFARLNIQKILSIVSILDANSEIINLALKSQFKDFEDAIQYYTAIQNNIEILITRNIKDYKKAKIKIQTPEEFLKGL